MYRIFFVLVMLLTLLPAPLQAQEPAWALLPSDLKIVPGVTPYPAEGLALHAGRGEYAPFQIMLAGEGIAAPVIDADPAIFSMTLYEEWFFPLVGPWEPVDYASAWVEADLIADGLLPITDGRLTRGTRGTSAVWVDLFVRPEAPAGDYSVTVKANGESRLIPVTVYPVDVPRTGSMSVLIPIDDGENIPHFAQLYGLETDDFHARLNQTMFDHYLVPGEFVAEPVWTGEHWDFSAYSAEISAIPVGDAFHAPSPFDLQTQRFFFTSENNRRYRATAFDDPYFVAQLNQYLADLRAYLESIGRLEDALLYPTDETFWVADEPDNNGPAGLERLRQWAEPILANGLGLMGSRVFPVAWGPGWPDPTALVTDSHVPVDYLDAAPELFAAWNSRPGHSTSIYLNLFGDLMNISAAMNRGILWHAYARDARTVAGYGMLEWYDSRYRMIDASREPEAYGVHSGYGSGALIYPDGTPSIRMKLLREGVEDMRLLDVYAAAGGDARALATCLTPLPLAIQNPPAERWNTAHAALLEAIARGTPVEEVCPPAPDFSEVLVLHDPDETDVRNWEFEGVEMTVVPYNGGTGMRMAFVGDDLPTAFYWNGSQDWSAYQTLLLDVYNESPYFAGLDVAVGDGSGTYLLTMSSTHLIPPNGARTLIIPLEVPPFSGKVFDWSDVAYIELAVDPTLTRRDRETQEEVTYTTGPRTLIVDNIRLAR